MNNKVTLGIVILLWAIMWSTGGYTQGFTSIHYSMKDGLPSDEVHHILRDRNNQLWFATDGGVSRFNGQQFETFNKLKGLADNVTFLTSEDRSGRIWVSTYNNNIAYIENDQVIQFKYNNILREHLPEICVKTALYFDTNRTLHISTKNHGLLQIDETGKLTRTHDTCKFGYRNMDQVLLPFRQSNKLNCDYRGVSINGTTRFKNMVFKKGTKGSNYCLVYNPKVNLINHKNVLLAIANDSLRQYAFDNIIQCIQKDHYGRIWVSVHQSGIRVYENLDSLFSNQPKAVIQEDKTVTHMVEDHEGGIWLSTLSEGVFYYPNFNIELNLPKKFRERKSIALVAHEDTVFALCESGQLIRIESVQSIEEVGVLKMKGKGNTRRQRLLVGMGIDPIDNKLMIADYPWNVRITGQPEKFRLFHAEQLKKTMISKEKVTNHTTFMHAGRVIGHSNGDMSMINFKDLIVEQPDTTLIHSLGKKVLSYCVDTNNRFILGCYDGLFVFHENKLEPYPFSYAVEPLRVDAVAPYQDSMLVFSSKGNGLFIAGKDTLIALSKQEGLSSDFLHMIQIDQQDIWVASDKGLNKITKVGDQFNIHTVTTRIGLPGDQIISFALMKNNVMVATTKGTAIIDKNFERIHYDVNLPEITGIKMNHKDTLLKSYAVLKHHQNNLEIDYNYLCFSCLSEITYQYRLVGDQNNWKTTTASTVNFTNMAPGAYVFEVKAKNRNGAWSGVTAFPFRIQQPFWTTWWFALFLLLVAAAIITLFVHFRLRKMQQKNTMVQLERNSIQMELNALKAQINPHFIFNSLNAIQSLILKDRKQDSLRYLENYAQLMRKSLNLSRLAFVELSKEIEFIKQYLDMENLRFAQKFIYTINVDEYLDIESIELPAMLLQPFLENSVNHGLLQKQGNGEINIHFYKGNEALICEITDNGIGRFQTRKNQKKENNASVGIALSERRLELINKNLDLPLNIRIDDLKSEGSHAMGTKVTVTIYQPFEENHDDL